MQPIPSNSDQDVGLALGLAPPSDVPSTTCLKDLTPLDWVHWLYLEPPAEAEVLVQACGRSFITTWEAERRHWLTHEMSAIDSRGNKLPDSLPRVVHVEPPCLALPNAQGRHQQRPSDAAAHSRSVLPLAAPDTNPDQPLRLLLVGHNLHDENTSVAARFLGKYMLVTPKLVHRQPQAAGSGASALPSFTASPPWLAHLQPGLQVFELLVHGIRRPGLLQLEGWCGRLLAWRWQVAVVDAPDVATELARYFQLVELWPLLADQTAAAALRVGGGSEEIDSAEEVLPCVPASAPGPAGDLHVDDLMTDLGCWLEFKSGIEQLGLRLSSFDLEEDSSSDPGSPGAMATTTTSTAVGAAADPAGALQPLSAALLHACRNRGYQRQMVDTALQLLGYCCNTAWLATAEMLLADLLSMGLTWSAIRELTTDDALTLLHRAVCSGSPQMVQTVASWGERHGLAWQWSEAHSASGITPLHLAAVLPSGAGGSTHSSSVQLAQAPLPVPRIAAAEAAAASGNESLADWILAEFDAACRYWHGPVPDKAGPSGARTAGSSAMHGSTQRLLPAPSGTAREGKDTQQQQQARPRSPSLDEQGRPRLATRADGTQRLQRPQQSPQVATGAASQALVSSFAAPAVRAPPPLSAASPVATATAHLTSTNMSSAYSAASHDPAVSKVARLDSDLQQVAWALQPAALLKASVAQFDNTRLETAYVLWLVQKRQRMRRLLPGCMACVFVTAMTQEFLQHGLSRGMLSFLVFAVPWIYMLANGLQDGKAISSSRLYSEEAWVAVMVSAVCGYTDIASSWNMPQTACMQLDARWAGRYPCM